MRKLLPRQRVLAVPSLNHSCQAVPPGAQGDLGNVTTFNGRRLYCSLLCIANAGRALAAAEVDLHHPSPHCLHSYLRAAKTSNTNWNLPRCMGSISWLGQGSRGWKWLRLGRWLAKGCTSGGACNGKRPPFSFITRTPGRFALSASIATYRQRCFPHLLCGGMLLIRKTTFFIFFSQTMSVADEARQGHVRSGRKPKRAGLKQGDVQPDTP